MGVGGRYSVGLAEPTHGPKMSGLSVRLSERVSVKGLGKIGNSFDVVVVVFFFSYYVMSDTNFTILIVGAARVDINYAKHKFCKIQ